MKKNIRYLESKNISIGLEIDHKEKEIIITTLNCDNVNYFKGGIDYAKELHKLVGKAISLGEKELNMTKESFSLKKLLPEMVLVEGLAKPYYMATVPVTQELYEAVMDENPSYFKNCPKCPVETVSWNDAQAFISKLNELTGDNYRLPTEAEWEFAARGGQKSKEYKFAGSNDLEEVGWYGKNSFVLGGQHPNYGTNHVGQKKANELGLYDMSGNVFEWCDNESLTDKSVSVKMESKFYKVIHGGSWRHPSFDCRVTHYNNYSPKYKNFTLGFRLTKSTKADKSVIKRRNWFFSSWDDLYSLLP